ncbi:MAG: hypothetical protein CME33_18920 [Gimesia sp.]|nr:hypothetical protein [Gimesia sp.]|tara:strand:+ start:13187 stop:14524 length:1338 start_codon:yes stop_codon:yes gene_type:complete
MKKFPLKNCNRSVCSGFVSRTGVTLMEVLMSVMIMSIGVVSLASLFPISIMRGVQATQLTNATVLRYNAEALIDAFPQLFVFDPDGTLNPNGHIAHQRRNRNYIVDPLGSFYASEDGTGLEASFGNDGSSTPVTRIPRYHAGLTTQLQAMNFFSQQDSWTLLYEGIPFSINGTRDTIEIDNEDINSGILSLGELQTTLNDSTTGGRILIYDSTGRQIQTRSITGGSVDTSTREISLGDPLPDNDLYDSISKVRIEILNMQYSYLLTVRRSIATDVASVDVVVFFRRNFSPEFEALHQVENFVAEWLPGNDLQWGVAGVDDDNDDDENGDNSDGRGIDEFAGEAGWPGSDDYQRRAFRLRYNNSVERPLLKKGGYVFDAKNARWYRIQLIVNEEEATAPGAEYADLILDQPIIQSINNPGSAGTPVDGLIVMPNVVQVYPLGNKAR